jgi:hypothetical protein
MLLKFVSIFNISDDSIQKTDAGRVRRRQATAYPVPLFEVGPIMTGVIDRFEPTAWFSCSICILYGVNLRVESSNPVKEALSALQSQ